MGVIVKIVSVGHQHSSYKEEFRWFVDDKYVETLKNYLNCVGVKANGKVSKEEKKQ